MGRMKVRLLAMVALMTVVGGVALIVTRFDGDWTQVGELAVVMGGQLSISAFFAGKRGTLDDAFEAGYQAGFHRGERVKPKVIRLPIERRRAPSLHRSQEPS